MKAGHMQQPSSRLNVCTGWTGLPPRGRMGCRMTAARCPIQLSSHCSLDGTRLQRRQQRPIVHLRSSRTAFRQSGVRDVKWAAAALDTGGGLGSGGSGAGGMPPRGVDAEEPGSNSAPGDPDELLAQAGAAREHLPQDMQEALGRGALSLAQLQQWLRLSAMPVIGQLCTWWPAFRDRVLGNPRFLRVLATEEVVGCTAKTIAEYKARGDKFWKEIDFVASDLSLEIIGDFAIVWLLSPKANFRPLPKSVLGRAYKALPGHFLQVGGFKLGQRLCTVLLRGTQFFLVGFGSSALGHTLTIQLANRKEQRKESARVAAAEARAALPWHKRGPEPAPVEASPHLAPVLTNSLGWGAFMAVSANMRYQLINGFEDRVLVKAIPNKAVQTAASAAIRFSNTIVGSMQWIWVARKLGLQ